MKKILLALLAVSMVLPVSAMAADSTTVYGQFRYSVSDVDATDGTSTQTAGDNTSLLGVKGSYGDDIKAYFHLQTGAKADASTSALGQRFFFGGLKGSFGNVKYGRLTNAYKMPGFKMDPLYNTAHFGATAGFGGGGATYGLSGATNGFTDNSIEYHSPKIADSITVNGGVYIDDGTEDDHSMGVGVKYSASGITVGAQTIMNDSTYAAPGTTIDEEAVRIYGSYKGKGFSVSVSQEVVATADADPTYVFATGSFDLDDKTTLVATFGVVDADGDVAVEAYEGTGITFSAFYDVTTNTKVFASFASLDLDDDTLAEDSPTALSIGVQHKFSTSN